MGKQAPGDTNAHQASPEVRAVEMTRWVDGKSEHTTDELAVEEPLEIRVRGRAISVTMRTPGHDDELALGFLLSEGLIRSANDIARVDPCVRAADGNIINVTLAPHVEVVIEAHEALRRALLSGQRGQGFEQVLEARARLQTALRVLVASVISNYPGYSDSERRQRSLILGPVMDQNGLVDNFLLRNEPISDVDPSTGQELAPPEEGGEAVQSASR